MRFPALCLSLLLFIIPVLLHAQQQRGIGLVQKPTSTSFVKGEYRALLIGNNDYADKKVA